MKIFTFLRGLLPLIAISFHEAAADEGGASLFVVDRSAESAGGAGTYAPYTAQEAGGADREILCLAAGPPGTTLLAVAFDRDAAHLDLAPVVAVQGGGAPPLRFPEAGAAWPLLAGAPSVDLYVAIFSNADPQLPWFVEYAGHLRAALAAGDRDAALLHSIAIRYRFSAILRQRSEEEFRVALPSGGEADAPRRPPASIAGATRGGVGKAAPPAAAGTAIPAAALASKALSRLDAEWREESHALPFAPASPGILIFPVAPPSVP